MKSTSKKPDPANSASHPSDELAAQLDSYRELAGFVPAILWRADPQTFQFTFVSSYAEALLGYPLQRWTDAPAFWRDHIYPEDQEWAVARRSQVAKEGGNYDLEYRMVASDGRALWVRDIGRVFSRESKRELVGVIVDLSKKRSGRRVLGKDKRWLRQLIDTIPVQIWSSGADGTVDFCNARWRSEMGLSLEELQGDGWQQVLHAEDREPALKQRAEGIAKGNPYEYQSRRRTADGQCRWFLTRVVALRDESGTITRWFGANTDIENQKQAEDALRESEQRWRGVFENTRIGVAVLDASLHFIDTNEAYQKMMGYNPDELRSMKPMDVTTEADRPSYQNLFDEVSAGKRDHFDIEKRNLRKDGESIWVRSNGSSFGSGENRLWIVMVSDISERKRAEEDLRESETRLRAFFNNSPNMIFMKDPQGRYLYVNQEVERVLRITEKQIKGKRDDEIFPPEQGAAFRAAAYQTNDRQVLRAGTAMEFEEIFVQEDGPHTTIVHKFPLFNAEGTIYAIGGVATDVTELKHLQGQLQRERDRLRLLLDLNLHFISKLELHDFFEAVAEGLRRVEGWDGAAILLPEPSTNDLRLYLTQGIGDPPVKVGTLVPIDDTISGKVYKSREPEMFRFDEIQISSAKAAAAWYRQILRSGLKVGCALPLIHNNRVLGVLVVATRRDQETATHDMSFLQELARLIAMSLSNALRYEQVNESRERLVSAKNWIEDQIRTEFSFETIVGASQAIKDVLKQVETVAPTDSTVLILGETGTGKELIARAICDRSPRRDHGFIKVDCSAIPGTLMESELFGHEKGAFTGATTQRLGRFEIADKGTLFLDEIGDVPLELQPKLLRVLQDQAFERLGSNRTRRVDVRIIAATHRNLEEMVAKGDFREDLYYRLKVFPITIPPLRERPEDIPPLVRHYVAKYAQRMKKDIKTIPARTMEVFTRYSWPGNIRELQHFLERSVILSPDHVLQAPLLNLEQAIRRWPSTGRPPFATRTRTMEEVERETILQALKDSNWVVGGPHGAAAKLGLKRTTLASRMESLEISRYQK